MNCTWSSGLVNSPIMVPNGPVQESYAPVVPQPGCGLYQGPKHSTPLNQSQATNPFLFGVLSGAADANLNGQNHVGLPEACGGDQGPKQATVLNLPNVNKTQATNPFLNGIGHEVAGADVGQQLLAGISVLGGVESDKQTTVSGNSYFIFKTKGKKKHYFYSIELRRCISFFYILGGCSGRSGCR